MNTATRDLLPLSLHRALTWPAGLGWLAALIGYFGPWAGHPAAALAWNAHDLPEIVRLLPQVESGALAVNLQALRLPLIALALVIPLLLVRASPGWRWGASLLGMALTASTLPPYPQIVTAWRTPAWRVTFWWGVGATLGCPLSAWLAPHLGRLRPWLIVGEVTWLGIPAFVTFSRLKPALRALHGAPVRVGWGVVVCALGLLSLSVSAWLEGWIFARREHDGL
ncbi:MAG: hypothetical protein ACP5HM_14525 [Anaerolineae bacterium]